MVNFTHLRKDRAALLDEAEGILTAADSTKRGLTLAETSRFDTALRKVSVIDAQLRDASQFGTANDEAALASRGITQPYSASGYVPAGGPLESLGAQLRSVIAAGRPGQQTDPRLFEIRAASGMGESVPSEGGFAVQSDFSYSLLQAGMARARLAPRCRPFPIGANSNSIKLPVCDETSRVAGSRWGGLSLQWVGEAGTIAASKPKLRQVNLTLEKLTGAVYLTDELVQDVTVLENFVRQAFADEFGYVVDDAILRADGAGKPLGILNSPALVTVNKENAQAADTILAENIVKMYSRSSNPEGSVWLANIICFPMLSTLTLSVGTGGAPIGLLRDGIQASPTGLGILGRPLIWMEQCSAIGDVGDILFVDPARYLLASKGGLQIANSIHVRFLNDESVLRFVYRVDGQPDIASAITPAYGSDTVSPFIALEAR